MEKKVKAKDLPTVAKKKRLKATHNALKVGAYSCGLVPATVITAVNANEWFVTNEKVSVSFGFVSLILAVVTTLVSAINKDNAIAKKFGALLTVGLNALIWGVALMLLSSLLEELASMFLFTAIGILTGGIIDTYDTKVVQPELAFYTQLCEENSLSKTSNSHEEAKRQAEKDKIEAKKNNIW